MSEPRKLNTGDAQRTVYHADGSAPRNIQADAAASQQSYEEARPGAPPHLRKRPLRSWGVSEKSLALSNST